MCLFADHSSSSAHIMVLQKFTFVLLCDPFLSPLACRWRFAVCALWLQCKTKVSAELAGALLMLFSTWNVTQHAWKARGEMKHSQVTRHDQVTCPLLKSVNEACTLTVEHSIFSIMAGLIVEILSCCSLFITLRNGLKMSEYEVYWLSGFLLINS